MRPSHAGAETGNESVETPTQELLCRAGNLQVIVKRQAGDPVRAGPEGGAYPFQGRNLGVARRLQSFRQAAEPILPNRRQQAVFVVEMMIRRRAGYAQASAQLALAASRSNFSRRCPFYCVFRAASMLEMFLRAKSASAIASLIFSIAWKCWRAAGRVSMLPVDCALRA